MWNENWGTTKYALHLRIVQYKKERGYQSHLTFNRLYQIDQNEDSIKVTFATCLSHGEMELSAPATFVLESPAPHSLFILKVQAFSF